MFAVDYRVTAPHFQSQRFGRALRGIVQARAKRRCHTVSIGEAEIVRAGHAVKFDHPALHRLLEVSAPDTTEGEILENRREGSTIIGAAYIVGRQGVEIASFHIDSALGIGDTNRASVDRSGGLDQDSWWDRDH